MSWETSKKPLILAHRGFTERHVENSLEAVEAAMKLGVDGVEVDLRMTADNELVIFHDKTLKRLADRDENIEELTSSSIRQVDLQGSHLPTLEELLDLVQDKLLLNLEIKTVRYRSAMVEKKLLATLRAFGFGPSVLVSAFHPLPLYRLSHLAPELRRGYLSWNRHLRTRHRLLVEKKVNPSSLNIALEDVTQKTVHSGQMRGRRIFVWTVNEPDDMNRMVSWGVDGIFSDRPDRLLLLRANG